jgi:hypothetical protein
MFRSTALHASRSPLPQQGEGEGEGPSNTKERGEFTNPSPPSSPLAEGERREELRALWSESRRSECITSRRCLAVRNAAHITRNLRTARWLAAVLVAINTASAATKALPIYIEDNHAGTFYWLAQNIDLDRSYTLVLFGAHSDASGIFDSDKIRYALRNVASTQERQTLLDRWRSKGTVQCFNWIEPLMPAPIEKVLWVPSDRLSVSQIRERREEATAFLDGHLEAAPRKSGSLREAYIVSDLEHLQKEIDPNQRLIVTIDLDYFAGVAEAEREQAFARIWNFVIGGQTSERSHSQFRVRI